MTYTRVRKSFALTCAPPSESADCMHVLTSFSDLYLAFSLSIWRRNGKGMRLCLYKRGHK